jgi:4-hydroxybenzoate polyprenyltransferase
VDTLTALVDLSRARQALLSVAQPALAAMLAAHGLPPARTIVLGLVAAGAGFLAVFSLNDVLDRRADKESLAAGKGEFEGYDLDTAYVRHPLARGDISLAASLTWVGGLGVLSALAAFALSPLCLAFFGAAVGLETLYCVLRSVTWLKTVVSGLMVAVGGLAGWVAVAPLSAAALPIGVFLALWEIGGRNLPNDLADLRADKPVGIKTVATVFGERASARATFAVGLSALLSITWLALPPGVMAFSLVAGLWSLAAPGIELMRRPTCEEAGRYFNRASLLPALIFAAAFAGALLPQFAGAGR